MIHAARRLLENLRARRARPPIAELETLEEPGRFVWRILPYVARTFSLCIALLPRRTARPLAAAYLYCRMLDTCEDLPRGAAAKEQALRAFLARFDAALPEPAAPVPRLDPELARDDRDRAYLLLLRRAARVDAFFATLPEAQRVVVLRLVRRMGEGMIWAVRTFGAQGGALAGREQLSRYCFEVLGNPMLFAEEMQRLERGLEPVVPPERVALAARAGEAIQLANVARDLEKDRAAGICYLPELRAAPPAAMAGAIAAARRELLARALECGRAFRPFMAGIPSPRVSLARGAGLAMAIFTLAFWQRTSARIGLELFASRDRVTRIRSIGWVARAVSSRAGFEAALRRLDRIFADGAARLSEAGTPHPSREPA